MANVLCIGVAEGVSKEQSAALEGAGHSLSEAKDVRQVITACSGIQFDVVLIGHSLPAMEKLRVGDIVRRHCGVAKILELHNSSLRQLPAADAHLRVRPSFVDDLLKTIDRLTMNRRKTA